MVRVVRESKFRHVFGRVAPKDQQFDDIQACDSRLDGNICALNRKFIAIALSSSGAGVFTILRRDRPGRVSRLYRCTGHSSDIVDLSFDRFYPNRLASGGDDGSFIIWIIPPNGLENDLSEFYCQFKPSTRRAIQGEWHTSARNVFIGVNIDCVSIFNVKDPAVIRTIDTSSYCDQMFSFSLNFNSTKFAAGFKDKKVRVFDTTSGNMLSEFTVYDGSRPIKVAWLTRAFNEELIVTTGSTKTSMRQISVWNVNSTEQALCVEDIDNSSSPMNIVYDPDTHLIVFHGKGESSIRMYEFDLEPEPKLQLVATHSSADSHRACAFGNKLSCNFNAHEILNLIRVCNKGLEPVAIVVPRKSDQFQEDIFPPTASETPAMDVEEFIEGKIADPILVNLKGFVFDDGTAPPAVNSSNGCVTVNRVGGEGLSSPVGSALNIYDLNSQVSDLKAEVAILKERLDRLEKN